MNNKDLKVNSMLPKRKKKVIIKNNTFSKRSYPDKNVKKEPVFNHD